MKKDPRTKLDGGELGGEGNPSLEGTKSRRAAEINGNAKETTRGGAAGMNI